MKEFLIGKNYIFDSELTPNKIGIKQYTVLLNHSSTTYIHPFNTFFNLTHIEPGVGIHQLAKLKLDDVKFTNTLSASL